MVIGIDIDDTIALTNKKIIEEAIKYDKDFVRGRGFKNKNAYSFMEMFYWSVLDVDGFLKTIKKGNFFNSLEVIPGAVLNINKLYSEGNKIVFITRRSNSLKIRLKTSKWLKDNGFKYHKLVLGGEHKDDICSKYGVDIFIDNDLKNIVDVSELGIKAILKGTEFNKDEKEYKRIDSWDDIYDYIVEVKNEENR